MATVLSAGCSAPRGFLMKWVFDLMLLMAAIVSPAALMALGMWFIRRRILGSAAMRSTPLLPDGSRDGCPPAECDALIKMERRLATAHSNCLAALDSRLGSELARARVAPALDEAFGRIRDEIESIYAFCERNDLAGTLKKASSSSTAKDIYLQVYQRGLAKVQDAILKTEKCLAAYERAVATLEVSSVGTDIGSDCDIAIEMLNGLREELPHYNLEDRV